MVVKTKKAIGTCRHVLMLPKIVIKFPRASAWDEWNPSFEVLSNNMYANRWEAECIRKNEGKVGIPKLYFADPFGLIVIMKRYTPLENREEYKRLFGELLEESDLDFDFWVNDGHINQFCKTDEGKLVKIDLG